MESIDRRGARHGLEFHAIAKADTVCGEGKRGFVRLDVLKTAFRSLKPGAERAPPRYIQFAKRRLFLFARCTNRNPLAWSRARTCARVRVRVHERESEREGGRERKRSVYTGGGWSEREEGWRTRAIYVSRRGGRTLVAVVSNRGRLGHGRAGVGGHDNAPPRVLVSICRNESRDTGLKVSAGWISLNYYSVCCPLLSFCSLSYVEYFLVCAKFFFFWFLAGSNAIARDRAERYETNGIFRFFLESLLKVNIPYSENNALQYQIRIFNECVVYTCDRG